jgi:hypothetical protein
MTWEPLEGTKREWGEGMVEKKVAITQDETVSIVCHESVAQYAQVHGTITRKWVGLTDEEIAYIESMTLDTQDAIRMAAVALQEKNA